MRVVSQVVTGTEPTEEEKTEETASETEQPAAETEQPAEETETEEKVEEETEEPAEEPEEEPAETVGDGTGEEEDDQPAVNSVILQADNSEPSVKPAWLTELKRFTRMTIRKSVSPRKSAILVH